MFTSDEVDAGTGVIRGAGKLNMVTAPELRNAVLPLIAHGRSTIVVDFSEIDFIDSSGLGSLISCLKSARQAGGNLRIAAPSKQVSMVLKLSNLDRVLTSFDSVEDALHV